MTDREKEVENKLLWNEQDALTKIKAVYAEALSDVKVEIKHLQKDTDLPSKIYRADYQIGIAEEIESITAILNDKSITTVDAFLQEMYEDGYGGIIYAMQGRGLPITVPIDQRLLINSVTRETDSLKISTRLYNNVAKFKKDIIFEISRGIAANLSYKDIALWIALKGRTSFNRAYTISRTEGHRVATEAKADSITALRGKGADIIKYWDATLDHVTRTSHARLHGQWVEDGEYFTTIDHKTGLQISALYPSGFGLAHEDINCRCCLLARPRWAVTGGKSYTHIDNITDETIEANSFGEWIKKYHAQNAVLNKKYASLLGGE